MAHGVEDRMMTESTQDAIRDGKDAGERQFPHAPDGWTPDAAQAKAKEEGLILNADHWQALRALQGYYARREATVTINVRELHDALEERFHRQGGIRYLYQLFPGGPVAQGCRIAGLTPPVGASDKGFGSVV